MVINSYGMVVVYTWLYVWLLVVVAIWLLLVWYKVVYMVQGIMHRHLWKQSRTDSQ